ncbi:hypothetical protein WAX74_14995 [Psychrobacillus sp. FJAT-51614]|uniref:Uncharacterized protein n=1 Tax=Psychrobacillus mangrovi TaxID=3117745 RepID=A0ABU8F7D5_9BACI
MTKKLFPSYKIAPAYLCHKIIEVDKRGVKVFVKDTTSGRLGEVVEDENEFLQTSERVAVHYIAKDKSPSLHYVYNFNPTKSKREILLGTE